MIQQARDICPAWARLQCKGHGEQIHQQGKHGSAHLQSTRTRGSEITEATKILARPARVRCLASGSEAQIPPQKTSSYDTRTTETSLHFSRRASSMLPAGGPATDRWCLRVFSKRRRSDLRVRSRPESWVWKCRLNGCQMRLRVPG